MCIIVVKPKGSPLPSLQLLKTCYINNPHGCGFMYDHNDQVHIKKGFFNIDEFYSEIMKIHQTIDLIDHCCVFHFRIATHGHITTANCHPFPISQNINDLVSPDTTCTIALAHNGIIKATKGYGQYSDTLAFVQQFVYPAYQADSLFYLDKLTMMTLHKQADSKLCFLANTGDFYLYGDFIQNAEMYFSNYSFLPRAAVPIVRNQNLKNAIQNMQYVRPDIKEATIEYDEIIKKVKLVKKYERVYAEATGITYKCSRGISLGIDKENNLYEIIRKAKYAVLIDTKAKII